VVARGAVAVVGEFEAANLVFVVGASVHCRVLVSTAEGMPNNVPAVVVFSLSNSICASSSTTFLLAASTSAMSASKLVPHAGQLWMLCAPCLLGIEGAGGSSRAAAMLL
jgi:hypothetical protein